VVSAADSAGRGSVRSVIAVMFAAAFVQAAAGGGAAAAALGVR
jgi:hypothetical protein